MQVVQNVAHHRVLHRAAIDLILQPAQNARQLRRPSVRPLMMGLVLSRVPGTACVCMFCCPARSRQTPLSSQGGDVFALYGQECILFCMQTAVPDEVCLLMSASPHSHAVFAATKDMDRQGAIHLCLCMCSVLGGNPWRCEIDCCPQCSVVRE